MRGNRSRRRAAWVRLTGGMLLLAGTWATSAAEDVVYLKPREAGAAGRVLRGEIVDYTGRSLLLKSATKREQSIPADRVERIETQYSPDHTAGDRLLAAGDYRGALEKYRLALAATREPRDWVRRKILAQIVWCWRNLDRGDQAGEYFLILLSRDADTRDFACIPLAWTPAEPPAEVVEKADAWLDSPNNAAAVLMGASALLATDKQPAAAAALERLSRHADRRIAWLATAQLWRLAAPRATSEQLRAWSEEIARHEPALRAGAYFVLGEALAPGRPEDAALALLRVPIEHPREQALAAAALLEAGGCLERVERGTQATTLYREVADRYGATTSAREARRRLARLSSGGPARDN